MPDIRITGVRSAMRALLPPDRPDMAEMMSGFLPDAYLIRPEARELYLIEIIDTSPISFDKAALIHGFGEAIDEAGWWTSVVTYDYAGTLLGVVYYQAFSRHMLRGWQGHNLRDALPAALAAQREIGWAVSRDDPPPFASITLPARFPPMKERVMDWQRIKFAIEDGKPVIYVNGVRQETPADPNAYPSAFSAWPRVTLTYPK